MSGTDLWKTHPIVNFIILGHETGQFLENSSKIEHFVVKWYSKNSEAYNRPISGKFIQIWTSFPEIGLAHAPILYKNWIGTYKKLLDEFPRNPCHTPVNWNFWMSFPGFANKGSKLFTGHNYLELNLVYSIPIGQPIKLSHHEIQMANLVTMGGQPSFPRSHLQLDDNFLLSLPVLFY